MRKIVLFLILSGIFLPISAQYRDGFIDSSRVNIPWLEYLIKTKIDSVRKINRLSPLTNDSICYLAARDQSAYVMHEKKITHYQQKNKKRTPQDRISLYGGEKYLAGENLMRIPLFTPYKGSGKKKRKNIIITTYEDAAFEIVNSWVNNPGHLQNILHEPFKLTAVSVSYNMQTKEINAAQVFARVPSYFLPVCSKIYFPYDTVQADAYSTRINIPTQELHKDHAWKVRSKANEKDLSAWKSYKPNLDYSSLAVSNRTIVFTGGKYKAAEQFLKKKHDGLMAEVVPFSRYSCGLNEYSELPGRRNGGCIFNGIALKPLYKKELLNTNLLGKVSAKKPRKLSVTLGKVPATAEELNEINILVLKRRNIVGMVQFHHLRDTLFQYVPQLPYLDLPPVKLCGCYTPEQEIKKSNTLIFYPVNETLLDTVPLHRIFEILMQKDIIIRRINIRAFASIEGNFSINDRLYKERARIIHDSLRYLIPAGVPVTESAGENWGKFREQVRLPRYTFLAKLDTLSIRKIMNDSATTSLKPMLDAQRYSQVEIEYEKIVRREEFLGKALTEYIATWTETKKKWEKSGYTRAPDATVKKRLGQLYDYFLQSVLDSTAGNALTDTIPALLSDDVSIARRDPLSDIYAQKTAFDFQYRPWKIDESYRLNAYRFLAGRTAKPDPAIAYNYQAFLINHFEDPRYEGFDDSGDLKALSAVLESSKNIVPPDVLEQMTLFYHFARARNIAMNEVEKYPEANSSLEYMNKYFSSRGCSNKFRIDLALFFLTFQRYDLANNMLEPAIRLPGRNKEAYTLWLKIYYAQTGIEDLAYSDYQPLFEAATWLSPGEFCRLFETPDRINFQVLNYEPLRNLYCRMKDRSHSKTDRTVQ